MRTSWSRLTWNTHRVPVIWVLLLVATLTPGPVSVDAADPDAPNPPQHVIGRASNNSACVVLLAPVNVGPADAFLTRFTLLAVPRPPGQGPSLVTRGALYDPVVIEFSMCVVLGVGDEGGGTSTGSRNWVSTASRLHADARSRF